MSKKRSGQPPYFKFFPEDFLIGCAHFSPKEVGIYMRLLCYQWSKNGLPNDKLALSKMVGCRPSDLTNVLKKFIEVKRDLHDSAQKSISMLVNARLEQVREEQMQYSDNQRKKVNKRYKKRSTAVDSRYNNGTTVDLPSISSSITYSNTTKEESSNAKANDDLPKQRKKPDFPQHC
jgi:uncharacterized protein YdaU (DUF1376 family)